MIALVTTSFLIFYIFVPGILFRFASSLRVRLKLFQRTRTQEATFSVAVALLPFALALYGTWYLPVMRHQPFAIVDESLSQWRQDYRSVTTLIVSTDASRFLDNGPAAASSSEENWRAIGRVLHRQMRFLFWYFLAACCEGWIFGYLASKYGDWQLNTDPEERLRANLNRLARTPLIFYNWIAVKFILPNISEWHMLLTNFNWPRRDGFFVSVDILQSNEHLYQGRVADYFIDSDGKLTGILLKNVSRFDRQAYVDARTHSATPEAIPREDYWRNIPSNHFYIGYASIVNLNVRFAPRDQALISMADKILRQDDTPAYELNMEPDDQDDSADSQRPDIYS
ncbi:hypothetical protein ACFPT7_18925 [Acidicapsa dinghuensis]|uniref:Uncharacterized protein n=1 Tax=Acidicapsa dinghuensis TaxID=2218256 RepID=A0ABW1EM75_9BACT|nr:hypothetical protein [Acidicapsa dinghuensis]